MSERQHRRQFLHSSAAFVAALHAPLILARAGQPPAATRPRLPHVELQTAKLEELRRFYGKKLGLPVRGDSQDGFDITAGTSNLRFVQPEGDAQPFYHFAFNIPENQFASAKTWLKQRTPLLIDSQTGKDEVHFAAWNAHAVYFRDPAGNIGELIARHRLKNGTRGAFSEAGILCVSEIGIVTDEASRLGSELATLLNWPKSGSELVFVGDDLGYLIVAPVGRPWLPDRVQKAARGFVHAQVNARLSEPRRFNSREFYLTGTG